MSDQTLPLVNTGYIAEGKGPQFGIQLEAGPLQRNDLVIVEVQHLVVS